MGPRAQRKIREGATSGRAGVVCGCGVVCVCVACHGVLNDVFALCL